MADKKLVIELGSQLAGDFGSAFKSAKGRLVDLSKSMAELKKQQSLIKRFEMQTADLSAAKQKLDAANESVRKLRAEIQKNPTKKLREEFTRANQQAEKLRVTLQNKRIALGQTREAMKSAGISTHNTAEAMADLGRKIEKVATQSKKLQALKQQQADIAQGFGDLKAKAVGAFASIASTTFVVKPAFDFQAAASELQAKSAGMMDDQRKLLEDKARELGRSMRFTATEAMQGMTFLSMAGFDPKEIEAAAEGMLNLAQSAGMGLAETADIASNILSGFKLEATEMDRAADVLAHTFTTSNVTLYTLGETMKYVAPVATAAGQSIEEMAVMTGMLGDVGIQGSNAGTALRAALLRLADPPKKAAEALHDLGVKTMDAEGNMRAMPAILGDIQKKTEGMGNGEILAKISQIFGVEAAAALTELVSSSENITAKYNNLMENAAGTTDRVAKTMGDNAKGAIIRMGSAFNDLGITLGNVFLPHVQRVVDGIAGMVGSISSFLSENPRFTQALGLAAAAIAAVTTAGVVVGASILAFKTAMLAFGPVITGVTAAFSGLTTALPLVAGGIKAIGVALVANPIGLAVTAIAGAAALIIANWETVGPFFSGLWRDIQSATDAAWRTISTSVSTAWSEFTGVIQSSGLADVALGVFNDMKAGASTVMSDISSGFALVWSDIKAGIDTVAPYIGPVWETISSLAKLAFDIQVAAVKTGWTLIKGVFEAFAPAVAVIYENLWEGIKAVVPGAWEAMKTIVSGGWDTLKTVTKAGFQVLTGDFSGAWETIKSGVKQFTGWIEKEFPATFKALSTLSKAGLQVLQGDFSGAWKTVKSGVLDLRDEMISQFKALVTKMTSIGKDIIAGLAEGIKNAVPNAIDAVKNTGSDILQSFKDFFEIRSPSRVTKAVGADITTGLAVGIESTTDQAVAAADAVSDAVKTRFSQLADSINGVLTESFASLDFSNLGSSLLGKFQNDIIKPIFSQALQPLSQGIANTFGSIGNSISGLLGQGQMFQSSGPGVFSVIQGGGISGALGAGGLGMMFGQAIGQSGIGSGLGAAIGNFVLPGLGGLLGGALGSVVEGLFGGKKKETGRGFDLSYSSSSGVEGQNWTSYSKKKSFFRGTKRWKEYSKLDPEIAKTVGNYFDTLNTTIVDQVTAFGVDNADAILDAFEMSTASFSGENAENQLKNWLKASTRKAYHTAFKELDPHIKVAIQGGANHMAGSAEEIAARFEYVAAVATSVKPVLESFGLQINSSFSHAVKDATRLADAMGGVQNVTAGLQSVYQNLMSPAEQFSISFTAARQKIIDMNDSLGLTGDKLITTKEGLLEYIRGLNLSKEEHTQLAAQAIEASGAMATFANAIAGIQDMFANTIAQIENDLLSQQEKVSKYMGEAATLFDQLKAETDPGRIAEISEQINQAVSSAWSNMTEDQKAANADYLKTMLQSSSDLAAEQLKGAMSNADLMKSAISAMEKPVSGMGQAATTMTGAAGGMQSAASAMAAAAAAIPRTIDVNVSTTVNVKRDAADGSHATGLYRVKKDGYHSILHKDELVATAPEADLLRSGMPVMMDAAKNIIPFDLGLLVAANDPVPTRLPENVTPLQRRADAVLKRVPPANQPDIHQEGDTITLHIHQSPGESADALVNKVMQALRREKTAKERRQRGGYYDMAGGS